MYFLGSVGKGIGNRHVLTCLHISIYRCLDVLIYIYIYMTTYVYIHIQNLEQTATVDNHHKLLSDEECVDYHMPEQKKEHVNDLR